MQSKAQIDQILRQKSDAAEIPGAVAMAANGKEVIYQGAFGKRDLSKDDPMTAVGAGRMPVAEILAAAPSAEWHIVELDRCATDMLTAVEQSLQWLAGNGLATPARGSVTR